MFELIKKNIPRNVKIALLKSLFIGNKFYCNCCHSHLRTLAGGGESEPVIQEQEIIGAGYRKYDSCPVCKSSYRTRLVKAYLDEYIDLKIDISLLHIAPEEQLSYLFQRKQNIQYTCGDILPERYHHFAPSIKIDITDIPFPDNSFDLILCNHVLEHIPDDRKAMKQLLRVLKPQGKAILQVPVSLKLEKTYEDWSINSENERLKKFGQKDHVRIYGTDYVQRLSETGFKVETIETNDLSHIRNFNKLELDAKEKLFIAEKYE